LVVENHSWQAHEIARMFFVIWRFSLNYFHIVNLSATK
jgi:hypothetical protein